MKKLLYLVIPLALFTFLYARANSNAPKDIEIQTYKEGEVIDLNNCSLTASHKDLLDKEYFSILPIEYSVTNNNNDSYDCLKILYNMVVYNGYNSSTVQNINDWAEGIPEDQIPHNYDIEYDPAEFILAPGQSKDFILYYYVNKDQLKKFPACIKFANNLHKDTYDNKLANGVFYYEIIDLELGIWSFLKLDQMTNLR